MTRYSSLPPLWVRLCDAVGLSDAASLDAVHKKVPVVGRGTLQRIRSGVPGTQLRSLQSIADHLHIPVGQLMYGDVEAPPALAERVPTYGADLGRLVESLAGALDELDPDRLTAAAIALQALAVAPDSARARAAVVAALQPGKPNGKRLSSAA